MCVGDDWGTARVRATSYVTRINGSAPELLVFEYLERPGDGPHLPGGGVQQGERPDAAAVRETVEETGVHGSLAILGIVGVHQARFADTGRPYLNLFFHLHTTEPRDEWRHRIVGNPDAWDTGMVVRVWFESLPSAATRLERAGNQQEAFLDRLQSLSSSISSSWISMP
jgi:8-oxo-dGTP pyrophosphatase MutT (NUDIX family)